MENELKYIYFGDNFKDILKDLLSVFKENGFDILKFQFKEQEDFYYDTLNFSILQKEESLRIRKKENGFKGTYKRIVDNSSDYLVREEIECGLLNLDINFFLGLLNKKGIIFDGDFSLVLVVKNDRQDILVQKDNVTLCISLDNIFYYNQLSDNIARDKMIEIEVKDGSNDKILNEVNEFVYDNFKFLTINKDSKYIRGMNKTSNAQNRIRKKFKGNL